MGRRRADRAGAAGGGRAAGLREAGLAGRGRLFVWERPLRKAEIEERPRPPSGPILAARVENLFVKEALLSSERRVFFTTSHFDTVPAVLVRLERISVSALEQLTLDAWLCRAPRGLAEAFLAGREAG